MAETSDHSKNVKYRYSAADKEVLSIWIDSYDDIFSDFDPRPFPERTISDDFLQHARKVAREFRGTIPSMKILIPGKLRNGEHEGAIRKRIESHFSHTFDRLLEEGRSIRRKGVYFVAGGTLLMLISSYFRYQEISGFPVFLMLGLFEPGGWFLFWTGLDQLINFSKSSKGEIEFYRKLSSVHVIFDAY